MKHVFVQSRIDGPDYMQCCSAIDYTLVLLGLSWSILQGTRSSDGITSNRINQAQLVSKTRTSTQTVCDVARATVLQVVIGLYIAAKGIFPNLKLRLIVTVPRNDAASGSRRRQQTNAESLEKWSRNDEATRPTLQHPSSIFQCHGSG